MVFTIVVNQEDDKRGLSVQGLYPSHEAAFAALPALIRDWIDDEDGTLSDDEVKEIASCGWSEHANTTFRIAELGTLPSFWCYRVDDTDTGGEGFAAGPFLTPSEAQEAAKAHSQWLAERKDWAWGTIENRDGFPDYVVARPGQESPGDDDTVWFYIEQLQEPPPMTTVPGTDRAI